MAYNSYIIYNLNKARVISRKDMARAFLFNNHYKFQMPIIDMGI